MENYNKGLILERKEKNDRGSSMSLAVIGFITFTAIMSCIPALAGAAPKGISPEKLQKYQEFCNLKYRQEQAMLLFVTSLRGTGPQFRDIATESLKLRFFKQNPGCKGYLTADKDPE